MAAAVVLAHSAVAADHMGDAVAACIAVMEAAALGALVVAPARKLERIRSAHAETPLCGRSDAAPGRSGPPWARGSPFALQVLRL